MNDLGLALVLLGLHLAAMGAGGGLLVFALRSDAAEGGPDGGFGGPGGADVPPKPPVSQGPIGPPLPGAEPARLRLRARRPLPAKRRPTRYRDPCRPHAPAREPQPGR